MRCLFGRTRSQVALSLTALATLCGVAVATVIPRDLAKQLELIEAQKDGAVVYGTIIASEVKKLDDLMPLCPFTVLTVKVEQAIAPATMPNEIKVYVIGAGEERPTIAPPEDEVRVGESQLFFLRADAGVRTHDATAYKADSFAEVLRTQKNRKGEVIVLGEGAGSAIEQNVKLAELSPVVVDAVVALKNASTKQK